MSPSSVFPGFHTGRSHHPSPSSELESSGYDNIMKRRVKEEYEEYGVMEEFSEGHKEMMEPPNTRNPPREMSPSSYPGIPHRKSHHPSPSSVESNRYRI
ncbi:unnamed protein product [Staurois parvus]|uniref:Uncharacterized protein n=1 Tax=Staurois parvus TaxID=386267 RepID=A0ABN9BFM7_9NEOB|nr:unnamed protein product [Staurois parvus]